MASAWSRARDGTGARAQGRESVAEQQAALLVARGVTKRFGGLVAVNEVDFEIPTRAIVSLIGPNGAGKTTFFNIMTGLYAPTEGEIHFDGQRLTDLKPHDITRVGV